MCWRPQLFLGTGRIFLQLHPVDCSVLTDTELTPPAFCSSRAGEGVPTHRDTGSSCTNTSEQKQSRRTSLCSFMWKELCYPMGAITERCQIHSSQGINCLHPQTPGSSLSFPTPSGGGETWGTFPPQISGEHSNATVVGFCHGLS